MILMIGLKGMRAINGVQHQVTTKLKSWLGDCNGLVRIIWLIVFDQIFLSSQVKWSVIVRIKYGIYELPKGLRLRTLGNCEISRKSENFIEL